MACGIAGVRPARADFPLQYVGNPFDVNACTAQLGGNTTACLSGNLTIVLQFSGTAPTTSTGGYNLCVGSTPGVVLTSAAVKVGGYTFVPNGASNGIGITSCFTLQS